MAEDMRTAVLQPTGRLNMVAAPALKSQIEESVGAGRDRIVVDFSDVIFIDSSGLGALISGLKATRQAGGDLRIARGPRAGDDRAAADQPRPSAARHPTVADAAHEW